MEKRRIASAIRAEQREMEMNQESCHGIFECLFTGSDRCNMSPLLTTHQKYRSYILWWLENLGWRATVRHLFVRIFKPYSHIKNQPLLSEEGSRRGACDEVLGLQPGELVEVKSVDEIMATLDTSRRNKGLRWMTGMTKYCGNQYRVLKKVERIILESNGELRKMKNTVLLDGVMCDGRAFNGCDRSCFHFWREVWLRRTPEIAREDWSTSGRRDRSLVDRRR